MWKNENEDFVGFDNPDFAKSLKKANEQLEAVGIAPVTVESLDEGASSIAIDSEYRIALDTYLTASTTYSVEVSKLLLPILAIGFTIVTFFKAAITDPVLATWFGLGGFFVVGVIVAWGMRKSQKDYLRQQIAHAVLEHRIKQQKDEKSSNDVAVSELSNAVASVPETYLKQTILDALQEHQARQPLSLREMVYRLFHRLKN